MPIYQYKCRECGEVSDFLVPSFSDNKGLACPSCGNSNLERLMSAPNLLKASTTIPGATCCGRTERCETPPCSTRDVCRRR